MKRVVDYHQHTTPTEYVSQMKELGVEGNTGIKFKKFDPKTNLALMDKLGIKRAILSISTPGVYVKDDQTSARIARIVNDSIKEAVDAFPERYGGFGALPYPAHEESLRELEYVLDVLHLDGVVLLTNVGERYFGEPGYDELFAELNRRKTLVFVHPDDLEIHQGLYMPVTPYFERLLSTVRTGYNLLINDYLDRFPDIDYLFSHGGGGLPVMARRIVDEYIRTHDLPADATLVEEKLSLFRLCFYDVSQKGESLLQSLKVFCGSERVVFGTDLPYQPPVETGMIRKGLDSSKAFSAEEKKQIYAGTGMANRKTAKNSAVHEDLARSTE
jgi:predicted TIM-barrel fold metal-dependent hydrolase